jgi:3-methyladenine DNA glycosylase AlkD
MSSLMPRAAAARAPLSRVIADEVQRYCQSHADPDRVAKYARYFKEGYDAYGVDFRTEECIQQRRIWSQRLRDHGPAAFLDVGDLLVASGKYEEASFAILFATDHREVYTPEVFRRIGDWFEGGIRNWGHTDVLCSEVLSRFFIDGTVTLSELEPWRASSAKFRRRAVPVMLIPLLDYAFEISDLLAFIEPLMLDEEKVVQQGMGWFLREVWKRRPRPVEALLLKYRNTAPRLIFQYATEKMPPAARLRFRRQK